MINKRDQMIVASTQIQFLLDGKDYHKFYLDLIKSAQNQIVLHTYIFEFDEFGKMVFKELMNAADRGVSISFVVDGFGTSRLEKTYHKEMTKRGIKYYEFNKIRWTSIHRWGRRLHHKILVVDQKESIVGGINVVTPFSDKFSVPRLDFAFYLKGSISQEIERYCLDILKFTNKNLFKKCLLNYNVPEYVKFSVNDWVYGRKNIAKNYCEILDKAETEVIIINSYFFPRKTFLKKLIAASNRGVIVKLVLPRFSDWQSHVLASEYLYSFLLKNNIQVYQWDKSVLHGKMALVDRRFVMLGSFNLHYTSFQGNLEMNIEVLSKEFSVEIGKHVDTIIEECHKINEDIFEENMSIFLKIKRFLYYLLISIVSNFLLGFIHQEEIDKQEKMSKHLSILRIFVSFFIFILGVLGLVLPIIPGVVLIVLSFIMIYPIIIKNNKKQ